MLIVRRRGGAAGDIEPIISCEVCSRVMNLREAWLGFAVVSADVPQSPAIWLHRDCASRKMTLWRALDCFNRLMRETEETR